MGLFDTILSGDSSQQPQSPLDQLFSVTPAMRQQAANQAMLGMAAGLLQAGGPSRTPVNIGQALGAGIQQGLTGYNSAIENNMKQQVMAGELAKNKLGVIQSLAGQAAMARAFGQQAPDYLGMLTGNSSAAAPSASAAQSNPTAPATTPDTSMDAPAPGTWNAAPSPLAGAGFAPVAGLQSAPVADQSAPAASPDAGQPLLRLPPGMNGATAYALSMNPSTAPIIQKAIENQYPGPTNISQLQMEAANLPDGPQKQQLLDQITKLNYIAPASARPGGYTQDPHTGKWTWMPAVQPGSMPKFDTQGNFTGVAPIPGSAAVTREQSTAKAAGPASFEFEKVFDPKTQTYVYRSRTDMANGGGSVSGTGGFAGYTSPRGGSMQAGPALGSESATNAFAKGNAEDALGLQRLAADAPNRKANILSMESYLNDFKSGKGADAINNLKSYANTWLPNGFGFDPKKMSSQEIFTKGATQILGQQFKAMGTAGADNSLQTLKSGFPNAEMQDMANRYLLHTMAGNEDAISVRNNEMQKWIGKNGPQSVGAFNTEFNKHFDPRVFSAQYMNNDELTHLVQSMKPAQAQQFKTARDYAKQHGWIQ